jgi:phage terminase large subunit-like protein
MSAPEALLTTPEGRRAVSEASPAFFDTYYCGMRRAPHRDRWLSALEEARLSARARVQKAKTLLLAPRDHGKTEAACTYVTRMLCLDRDIRILWISESQTQAEKRLRRVASLLASPRILEDWTQEPELGAGPFRGPDDKWSATQIYLQRSRASVDPSLEAVGTGAAIVGGHFDLIVCDDLESDRNVASPTVRAKTREWWRSTVAPMLVRDGAILVIGTRKHYDDLYEHMIKDPTYRVLHDRAILEWPSSHGFRLETDEHGREVISGIDVEGGRALWEERPLDYLLTERRAIGERLFSREFQNEVQDDSAAPFKMAWIDEAKERGARWSLGQIPPEVVDIVQGWDFSLVTDPKRAEARDTDYTVGITWGRASNGDRYLIDIFRRRGMSQAELQGRVKGEYAKYGDRVRVVAVERNAFGELHFMGLQRSTDLPLKAHLTTSKKADPWEGVPALSVLFENAKVILPSRTEADRERLDPLIHELWSLGKAAHDDTVMSLWIAETWLRKSAFVYSVAFGEREHTGEADERMVGGAYDDEDPEIYRREQDRKSHDSIWNELLPSGGSWH